MSLLFCLRPNYDRFGPRCKFGDKFLRYVLNETLRNHGFGLFCMIADNGSKKSVRIRAETWLIDGS